jgi:hypothetical protein
MRRRALLILATMGLGVLLLGGVALADTIDGTEGPDDLIGTDKNDVIHGSGAKTTSLVWQPLICSTPAPATTR